MLTTIYKSLFLQILSWKQLPEPDFEHLRQNVLNSFKEQEAEITQAKFSMDDYQLAKFAVCAWIDELIMNTPSELRGQWEKNLLQSEYFHTTNAGEEFFERLENLYMNQGEVREIYYICLCLGFKGRYCWEEDEPKLKALMDKHFHLLPEPRISLDSLNEHGLSVGSYSPVLTTSKAIQQSRPKGLQTALWVILPPALIAGMYGAYWFLLEDFTQNLLNQLTVN